MKTFVPNDSIRGTRNLQIVIGVLVLVGVAFALYPEAICLIPNRRAAMKEGSPKALTAERPESPPAPYSNTASL